MPNDCDIKGVGKIKTMIINASWRERAVDPKRMTFGKTHLATRKALEKQR
jgi:hypothetical protein